MSRDTGRIELARSSPRQANVAFSCEHREQARRPKGAVRSVGVRQLQCRVRLRSSPVRRCSGCPGIRTPAPLAHRCSGVRPVCGVRDSWWMDVRGRSASPAAAADRRARPALDGAEVLVGRRGGDVGAAKSAWRSYAPRRPRDVPCVFAHVVAPCPGWYRPGYGGQQGRSSRGPKTRAGGEAASCARRPQEGGCRRGAGRPPPSRPPARRG